MAITYHSHDVSFKLPDARRVSCWLKNVVAGEGCILGPVTVVFCSDKYLLSLNREHLGHDYYTDIITFDYSRTAKKKTISGDLFISIETVKDNAGLYNVSFEEELHRVLVHGILHLVGYGDKTEPEIASMRKKENEALLLYPEL